MAWKYRDSKKKKNTSQKLVAREQLRALQRSNNVEDRRQILSSANPKLLKALKKIASEVLRGKVPVSSNQFRALKKHRIKIRQLATLKGSVKSQRRKLTSRQNGGFLPLLMPLLAPLIGTVISAITKKKK